MAKDKKICPLTYAVGKGAYDQEVSSFDHCVKDQCEWWLVNKCVIAQIAHILFKISMGEK